MQQWEYFMWPWTPTKSGNYIEWPHVNQLIIYHVCSFCLHTLASLPTKLAAWCDRWPGWLATARLISEQALIRSWDSNWLTEKKININNLEGLKKQKCKNTRFCPVSSAEFDCSLLWGAVIFFSCKMISSVSAQLPHCTVSHPKAPDLSFYS